METGSTTVVENDAGWRQSHPTSPCFRNSPAACTATDLTAAPPAMSSTRLTSTTPVAAPMSPSDEGANPTRWKSGRTLLPPLLAASRSRHPASGRRICDRTDEPADTAFGPRHPWLTLLNSLPGNETSSWCCLSLGFFVHLVSGYNAICSNSARLLTCETLVWMVGAVLPVPVRPERDMTERRFSDGNIDLRSEARTQMQYINAERLHDRVKWWRSVNRRMSIIGALILCLCIVLIVVGVKQQWHS